MTNPHNLKVGQKLYLVSSEHGWRGSSPEFITLTGVGKKWATFERYGRKEKVHLEELYIDGKEYSSPGQCWLSKKEYIAYLEAKEAWGKLHRRIGHNIPDGVTLEKINQARKILGFDDE